MSGKQDQIGHAFVRCTLFLDAELVLEMYYIYMLSCMKKICREKGGCNFHLLTGIFKSIRYVVHQGFSSISRQSYDDNFRFNIDV